MHLTTNEISHLLNTWNAWYLLGHDEYLRSEFSQNLVDITIKPFKIDKIAPEVLTDLKEYTDLIDLETPDEFKISFEFPAWEHQSGEIMEALAPILKTAPEAKIEWVNSMDFIEKDLPPQEEIMQDLSPKMREACEKKLEELQQKENSDGCSTPIDRTAPPERLHNEIKIEATIAPENWEIEKITHNKQEFADLPLFLEASRLFETVERNFEPPAIATGTSPYECADENEALMVKLILDTSTDDIRPKIVKENTINCAVTPEDLAAAISMVRYKKNFDLFKNPYAGRLRYKRRMQMRMAREALSKSCSCIITILFALGMIILWWFFLRKK